MKCPYRKNEKVDVEYAGDKMLGQTTLRTFAECYGCDCPFYDEGDCRKANNDTKAK